MPVYNLLLTPSKLLNDTVENSFKKHWFSGHARYMDQNLWSQRNHYNELSLYSELFWGVLTCKYQAKKNKSSIDEIKMIAVV